MKKIWILNVLFIFVIHLIYRCKKRSSSIDILCKKNNLKWNLNEIISLKSHSTTIYFHDDPDAARYGNTYGTYEYTISIHTSDNRLVNI